MIYYEKLVEQLSTQGFAILDNFFEEKEAANLRRHGLQLLADNQFQLAKIGTQKALNPTVRRDQIYWLDEYTDNDAQIAYFNTMKTIASALNQHLFLGLVEFETHFAFYSPGSFYKKHVDQFNNKHTRQISCVYYLNPEWQESFGGQLNLYNLEDELLRSIYPVYNRLVCFDSQLPHEVCTTMRERLSVAAWFKRRPNVLI